MAQVSVIVPARNAEATIRETLEALQAQDLPGGYEIIVVDDGSVDATPSLVQEAGTSVRLMRQSQAGPAEARNRGAAEARGGVLAFTDADCVPQHGWLRECLVALREADLVQGKVVPDPRVEPQPFDRTISVGREHGLYETANLVVRRSLFEALGGFEDWLPVRSGKPLAEDVWFGWRARRAGARIRFCEHAVVHHAVFRRSGWAYARERVRLAYFPAMVAKVPELRGAFLYRRFFLTKRSFAFSLITASSGATLIARRNGRRRLASFAALGAFPYLQIVLAEDLQWRRRAPSVLFFNLLADAVGMAALVCGSVVRRSPVL